MSWVSENITSVRDKSWAWFVERAHSKHALVWLAVVAFTDAVISPLVPEAFLAALMLARPDKWKQYLSTSIVSTTAGAAVGYYIGRFLFQTFGQPLLHLYGLGPAFAEAQHLIRGHVFIALALASFTPIPDKVFIYASGFLGVHFLPYIAGYMLGRGTRMAIVTYVVGAHGERVIAVINRYFLYVALAVVVLFAYYGIVHWHVLPMHHMFGLLGRTATSTKPL